MSTPTLFGSDDTSPSHPLENSGGDQITFTSGTSKEDLPLKTAVLDNMDHVNAVIVDNEMVQFPSLSSAPYPSFETSPEAPPTSTVSDRAQPTPPPPSSMVVLRKYPATSTKRKSTGSISSNKKNKRDGTASLSKPRKRRYEQCPFCEVTTGSKQEWENHIRSTHPLEEQKFCSTCTGTFLIGEQFEKHKRSRKCPEPGCNYATCSLGNYRNHLRLHQERQFACKDCGKMFRWKCDLEVHERIHTGEKPFECTECDKCFRSNSNLNKHMKKHHPKELEAFKRNRKGRKSIGRKRDASLKVASQLVTNNLNLSLQPAEEKGERGGEDKTPIQSEVQEEEQVGEKLQVEQVSTEIDTKEAEKKEDDA